MKPIKMTRHNEMLLQYPQSHQTDESELLPGGCIGIHDTCRGWVDLRVVSYTHWALVCRLCKLRVVVPNSLETFGELRGYLNDEGRREILSEGKVSVSSKWRVQYLCEEPKAIDSQSWCALCGKHIPSGEIRYIRGEKTAHQKCVEELYEALEPRA